MPLDDQELKAKCQSFAESHIAELLEGSYELVPGDADSDWDPILLKHVFTQPFVIWRNRKDVFVEVSPEGHIRSFRDQSRFESAKYEPLPPSDVLSICQTTGLISWNARVLSIQSAPEEMLAAVIIDTKGETHIRARFLVNCVSKVVAAFDFVEVKP